MENTTPLHLVELAGDLCTSCFVLAVSVRAGDAGSIPGSERSPGEGNGNPLQYSCLKNSTDRGAWQAEVHGVTKSQTQMSKHAHTLASMHSFSQDQPSFLAKMKYTMQGRNSPGWIQHTLGILIIWLTWINWVMPLLLLLHCVPSFSLVVFHLWVKWPVCHKEDSNLIVGAGRGKRRSSDNI